MRLLALGLLLLFACVNRDRAFIPLEGVALGGDSFSSGEGGQGGSPDAPVVTLSSPPARVRGDTAWTAVFSIAGKAPIVAAQLQYARDGNNISAFINIDASQSETPWRFEKTDLIGARFRLIAIDREGRLGSALSTPFSIDSTPPAVPSFTLDAPGFTRASSVALRIASCADASELLVSDELTRVPDDPALPWQACVTTTGRTAMPIVALTPPDGARVVSVWARDDVGNVSPAAATATIVLDTQAPVVTLLQPTAGADGRFRC
jgi:hypothetical protein